MLLKPHSAQIRTNDKGRPLRVAYRDIRYNIRSNIATELMDDPIKNETECEGEHSLSGRR